MECPYCSGTGEMEGSDLHDDMTHCPMCDSYAKTGLWEADCGHAGCQNCINSIDTPQGEWTYCDECTAEGELCNECNHNYLWFIIGHEDMIDDYRECDECNTEMCGECDEAHNPCPATGVLRAEYEVDVTARDVAFVRGGRGMRYQGRITEKKNAETFEAQGPPFTDKCDCGILVDPQSGGPTCGNCVMCQCGCDMYCEEDMLYCQVCQHCYESCGCACQCGICEESVPLEAGEKPVGHNGNLFWCNGCGEEMCQVCFGDVYDHRCDDCGAREAARDDGYGRYRAEDIYWNPESDYDEGTGLMVSMVGVAALTLFSLSLAKGYAAGKKYKADDLPLPDAPIYPLIIGEAWTSTDEGSEDTTSQSRIGFEEEEVECFDQDCPPEHAAMAVPDPADPQGTKICTCVPIGQPPKPKEPMGLWDKVIAWYKQQL